MCVVRTDTCTKTVFLEKSEEIDHAGIHVLPIEDDIVMRDNDWADGCVAPL